MLKGILAEMTAFSFKNNPQRFAVLVLGLALVLSSCNTPSEANATPTLDKDALATSVFATVAAKVTADALLTNPPTATVLPTDTLEPATATPEPTATTEVVLVPVEALCTANVTVRSWPGSGGDNLGGIFYGRGVEVLARNHNAGWLLIAFADSPTGRAWVKSSAFELKGDITQLPIALEAGNGELVFRAPMIWTVSGAPLPLPTLSSESSARSATLVMQAIIRVCPTPGCMKIGLLNPGEQIIITGRTDGNDWAQFFYPSGKDGFGWVVRDAIEPVKEAFSGLDYYDAFGDKITPEPPTATPDPNMSPTPSPIPTATPAGALAELGDQTVVYGQMSSLSPVIGTLNSKDKVHITAISFNGFWYEIQYPDFTDGRGYISAKNVRLLGDFRKIPYTDANGTPLPTIAP